MKYVAAYLLAALGGKPAPQAGDVSAIVKAAGTDCDDARLQELLTKVGTKPVEELLEAGKKKIAEHVVVVAAPVAAAEAPKKEEKKVEAKKEEPKEEPKEDDEDADIGGLFDF
jgi:ribosomal protein L12E/L44/L45/RPP1/RPP2